MYWAGLVLLGLGVVLLASTNPWQFFQVAQGTFFDWTELFWYLQWGGFWLVTASLLAFGYLAWSAPAAFALSWRAVPAGVGLVIFVLFCVYSMPEKSNQKDWKRGWVGSRVYVRTKIWLRGDEGGEEAIPVRLAGHWEAPDGSRYTFARDEIRMLSRGEETVWNARSCRGRFQMYYDFTFRPAVEWPIPDGLSFTPLRQAGAAPWISLPDRRFPRLSCTCDSETRTWVLVDIDRLLVFTDSQQPVVARRR